MSDKQCLYCLLTIIIAYLLYLNQVTINYYFDLFMMVVAIATVATGLYSVAVGGFFLAMKWLDIKERQAEILSKARFFQVLTPGQSLAIINPDGGQVLVTAPTLKALPAPQSVEPALKRIEAIHQQETRMLDFEKLLKSAYHFAIQAPTGAGKTTIVIELLNYIREPFPNADVLIIDPKNGDGWPIEPQITKLEDVLPALQSVWAGLRKRVDNREKEAPPVILIVDEHDWLFNDLPDDYIKIIRNIFKVGREYNYHLILIGQSPLSKDNGLSGSDWDNFGRIMLEKSATKFIKYGLTWKEMRKDLEAELKNLVRNGKRASIISPAKYLPFIAEIPHIEPSINFEIKPILIDNWPMKKSDITTKKKGLSAEKILSDIQKNPKLFKNKNGIITQASIAKFYRTHTGGSNHPVLSKIVEKVHQLDI